MHVFQDGFDSDRNGDVSLGRVPLIADFAGGRFFYLGS